MHGSDADAHPGCHATYRQRAKGSHTREPATHGGSAGVGARSHLWLSRLLLLRLLLALGWAHQRPARDLASCPAWASNTLECTFDSPCQRGLQRPSWSAAPGHLSCACSLGRVTLLVALEHLCGCMGCCKPAGGGSLSLASSQQPSPSACNAEARGGSLGRKTGGWQGAAAGRPLLLGGYWVRDPLPCAGCPAG